MLKQTNGRYWGGVKIHGLVVAFFFLFFLKSSFYIAEILKGENKTS